MPGSWVYILASRRTAGKGSRFTARYRIKSLVWFEGFPEPRQAIQREKTVKHYVRDWKINLIERDNPNWDDLFPKLLTHHGIAETDLRIIPADI